MASGLVQMAADLNALGVSLQNVVGYARTAAQQLGATSEAAKELTENVDEATKKTIDMHKVTDEVLKKLEGRGMFERVRELIKEMDQGTISADKFQDLLSNLRWQLTQFANSLGILNPSMNDLMNQLEQMFADIAAGKDWHA